MGAGKRSQPCQPAIAGLQRSRLLGSFRERSKGMDNSHWIRAAQRSRWIFGRLCFTRAIGTLATTGPHHETQQHERASAGASSSSLALLNAPILAMHRDNPVMRGPHVQRPNQAESVGHTRIRVNTRGSGSVHQTFYPLRSPSVLSSPVTKRFILRSPSVLTPLIATHELPLLSVPPCT